MTVRVGDQIPPWTVDDVDPQRMKTMAAILRDPYEVHWDRAATESLGLGRRAVNQGPLNLSYITNMLLEWQGPSCVRRLQVSFGDPVLDHESVTANGVVRSIEVVDGERRALCDVRLEREGQIVVDGLATVAIVDDGVEPGELSEADTDLPVET